ncbi:MAG: hypothetical protein LUE65_03440 [Clostridiales bacterium]|nr:hypothetical protein [Clostridiales bacterium]
MTNQDRITTKTAFYDFINSVTDRYDQKTAKKQFDSFEKLMFIASLGHSNPAFYFNLHKGLKLSDEIFSTYELLYNYLSDPSRKCLKLQLPYSEKEETIQEGQYDSLYDEGKFILNCNLEQQKNTTFQWEVPYAFLPYLLPMILSADRLVKGDIRSVTELYHSVDELANTVASKIAIEGIELMDFSETYHSWMVKNLGRSYFLKLEQICSSYATTDDQAECIKDSVRALTNRLLNVPSDYVILTDLLGKYSDRLYEVTRAKDSSVASVNILYPHDEPWITDLQVHFIQDYSSRLNQAANEALTHLNEALCTHHIVDSPFELAIDNPDSFLKEWTVRISSIQNLIDAAGSSFRSCFNKLLKESAIQHAHTSGGLLINQAKKNELVDNFSKCTEKSYAPLVKKLEDIKKMIKLSSDDQAKNRKSVRQGTTYCRDLKEAIEKIHDNYTKDLKSCNIPVLSYHNEGYLAEAKDYIFNLIVMSTKGASE